MCTVKNGGHGHVTGNAEPIRAVVSKAQSFLPIIPLLHITGSNIEPKYQKYYNGTINLYNILSIANLRTRFFNIAHKSSSNSNILIIHKNINIEYKYNKY
jgi:hypothetical protein